MKRLVVGDVSGSAFPAAESELGEIPPWMTAVYADDRDASCEHYHRDSGVMRKPTSAPYGLSPYAFRNVPPMRDLLFQHPLMLEGFVTEKNLTSMMDEFGRAANFWLDERCRRPLSSTQTLGTTFWPRRLMLKWSR